MIPLNLKLRNFMCYRDNVPPLSFNGIHTACLAGDNGNGKSALIDAMTWALWGKARAKSDDELVHTGQKEMEVEFDFAVGGQPYRIIRKRARPKRSSGAGQSILEFQMATDGGGFKSISGNSIAQTQQKISSTLHMDYDTFINSAFLRQGRADEFTTKRPIERKEVLANILGLSYYEQLEDKAKELARQQEFEKAQLESTLRDISDELALKPVYEIELEKAQHTFTQIEEVVKEKEARLNELRQQKDVLEKKKVQLDQLETSIKERTTSLRLLNEQVSQLQSRINEYETLIAQRDKIESGYTQYNEAKKRYDELDQKFRQSVNLEKQKTQLESRIKEAGQSLLTEHAVALERVNKLENTLTEFAQKQGQIQQLQTQLGRLTENEAVLSQKKQLIQELQTAVNYLESNISQVEREMKELGEKIDLLATQTEARCPLCETELGAEGLKLIESKYTADKQNKTDSLTSNQAELENKRGELDSLSSEVAHLEAQLSQEKIALQSQASVLNKEANEAADAKKQLAVERNRLSEIEGQLAKKDFASREQAALEELERQLAAMEYDAGQHEQLRQQLTELEQYESPMRKLEEADRLIEPEKASMSQAETHARELRTSVETDNQKREELAGELEVLPRFSAEVVDAENEYRELEQQQKGAQEALWNAKARLQHCAELETRRKEKEKALAQAAKEENIYRELARAFGKGGIQALLIEMALPEIEIEANRLLGRMTDNRMHVKFETQRETKKGDVMETLDITISDELGTRNYEMFSGGEAFRINFAIRIALSKLLARRAGAPLPTLIIDEGFGTQDSTGIEKLKEAINSIQDDFERILVITHIEELRDAFPTRIDVVKTSEGSTLSVN
ncbi:MAG: SMC family ATPase [Chloroflexota bacterium]|nr:SMC family ATPase [Chloroflexota bacterium]